MRILLESIQIRILCIFHKSIRIRILFKMYSNTYEYEYEYFLPRPGYLTCLLPDLFVFMANVTLVRRDSYLAHVKSGLKQDTLPALCQTALDLPTLFPDISKFEDKGRTDT